MAALLAQRTFDVSVIYNLIHIPELWETITEDGAQDIVPDVVKEYWVLMVADGVVIGCYNLHKTNQPTWQIHAFMLPEYRKDYSAESGRVVLKWAIDNIGMEKIICTVPTRYPNVIAFVKTQGFRKEGCNRQSFSKNGKLYDQVLFGMTKSEIIDFLGESDE